MADSEAQGVPGGSGHSGKPAGASAGAPEGDAPPSHEATNRPGMTNGVPDAASTGEAMGAPGSERQRTETAGNPEPQDEHGT